MKDLFLGTWQLVSCEIRDTNGYASYPYGQNAVGYLIYTSDGHISATLMSGERPQFVTADIAAASIDEQVMAFQTYLAYCGRYEIQNNKVIHHIETSLFPNWVGVDQERFFEFKDNQLTLSTPPFLMNGKQQIGYLIWQQTSKN
jgi:hypothetical protein